MRARAIVDGRGNAGTGACAAVITLADGRVIERVQKLKPLTNNEAEYRAVILAIKESIKLGVTHLSIQSDSQLIVNQLQGTYKNKKPHLAHLMAEAIALANDLGEISIEWVPRKKTTHPDRLCREIDRKGSPRPHPFKKQNPLPIVEEGPMTSAELLRRGY